jgi:hypothetical protein
VTGAPTLARRMSVRFAVALAIAVYVSGALAGPAAALGPGVFVDPGSPAGKEYGVPLSDLRGAASGHVPVGNQSPPLFGIGISPPGGTAARLRSAAPRGRSLRSSHGHPTGRTRPAATPVAGAEGAELVSGTVLAGITRHGSAVPAVALLGGLVVLGGLGVGGLLVAARRRLD